MSETLAKALQDAIAGQNLYHGRYGTTPAGRAAALGILSTLRNSHGLDLEAARPSRAAEPLDVEVKPGPFDGWVAGLRGPLVMVAVREHQMVPVRLLLPHQVYVKDVLALAGPGREVFVYDGIGNDPIRVDLLAAPHEPKEPTDEQR